MHPEQHPNRLENVKLYTKNIEERIANKKKVPKGGFDCDFRDIDDLEKELKFWRIVIEKAKQCIKLGGQTEVSHSVLLLLGLQ